MSSVPHGSLSNIGWFYTDHVQCLYETLGNTGWFHSDHVQSRMEPWGTLDGSTDRTTQNTMTSVPCTLGNIPLELVGTLNAMKTSHYFIQEVEHSQMCPLCPLFARIACTVISVKVVAMEPVFYDLWFLRTNPRSRSAFCIETPPVLNVQKSLEP